MTLAGSIFALHAGSATQNFSHNFGILGATASLIAFGRIQKASVLGLILALIYIGGIYLGTSEFIKSMEHVALIQSFGVPILSLAIMGTLSLIINRP